MSLTLNMRKTKIMSTEEKSVRIEIEGEEVETVDSYISPGSLVVSNGVSAPEMKSRTALEGTAMVWVWTRFGDAGTSKSPPNEGWSRS